MIRETAPARPALSAYLDRVDAATRASSRAVAAPEAREATPRRANGAATTAPAAPLP
jgi:hypothetical protein